MAATTISHNRPTAGSITWTAFNIAYDGANFTVPAGTTAAKFVWWVYNAGAPKLMTGDILPDLTADDTVLFLNKQGVGQLLPESTVVDGSLIVEESIYAQAIAADQIASKHIMSDAITTEHLSSNSVTAEQLSVGTVSANLVANGSFEDYDADGSVIGWEVLTMQGGTIAPVTGVSSSGAIAVQMNATATTALLRLAQKPDMFIPVSNASARRWYVSARMGVGTAITKGAYLRAVWYDANKTRLVSSDFADVRSNGSLTTTFSVYEGQVTPPALARYLGIEVILTAPNVVTKLYVDEVTVNEVLVAANIGDGQISTPKLVAKAVTADKIAIRDNTNLIPDPSFEAGGVGWGTPAGGSVVTLAAAQLRPGAVGTRAYQIVAASGVQETQLDALPAEAGESYWASCWVKASVLPAAGVTGLVGIHATVTRDGGLATTYPSFATLTANQVTAEWQILEGSIKLPTNTKSFVLRMGLRDTVSSGTFQFDDLVLRRMNGGELIVDGQIKTDHMTANTISGGVIAANTLVGSKLVADSITSRELVASEIWANEAWITAINGKTITGATVRTAATGARLEMTKTGLKGYAANGDVYLDASNGSISMEGELSVTAPTPDGLILTTKLGVTKTDVDGVKTNLPGIELSRWADTVEKDTYAASVITSHWGYDLRLKSGKPHVSWGVPPSSSQVIMSEGNVLLMQEAGFLGATGVHSQGHYTVRVGAKQKRLPVGMIGYWTNSTAVNLVRNTQLMSQTITVPPLAMVKVSLHLRGMPNINGQVLALKAFADNVQFGEHNHYSPVAWVGSDGTAFFTYKNTSERDKDVVFRITGTNVVPSQDTTFIIGARTAGTPPVTEVIFEDIGSLHDPADLLTRIDLDDYK